MSAPPMLDCMIAEGTSAADMAEAVKRARIAVRAEIEKMRVARAADKIP